MPYFIAILIVVLLYLVIIASDESRQMERKPKEKPLAKLRLTAKLSYKLAMKQAEIIRLKEENKDLIDKNDSCFYMKIQTSTFLKSIVAYMLDIQTINEMNISNYDKRQRTTSVAKAVERQCLDFITKNELDSPETNLVQPKC